MTLIKTNKLISTTLLSSLLLCSISSVNADDFPGVKALMTDEEQQQSGVSALNETQVKALNKWLLKYTARDSAIIRQTVESVQEEADAEIRSRIKGTFKGWKGNTKFVLDNGQVWQQRNQNGSVRWSANLENPEIIISKNFFGLDVLTVVKAGKKTKVKRLK